MPLWSRILLLLAIFAGTALFTELNQTRSPDAPTAAVTTLRFWNGFTGPDGRTMLRIVQRFNHDNPDVHILMQRMEWGTYYNKLFVASLGHRAPEIFVVQDDLLARFQRARMLRPLGDMVSSGLIPVDDLEPAAWNMVQYDHHPVGLPLDLHLVGMYYNPDLFAQAGITAPPANRDQFLDALRRLRDRHTIGFVFAFMRSNGMLLMKQFGGQDFTPDYSRCTLDDPRNVAALAFARSLIADNLAPSPVGTDAWIGFRQGKVGIAFEGTYMLADLERVPGLSFAGAPLPTLGDHPATLAGSHVLCLRPDLSGESLHAAERFLRFLSDHSLEWAAAGQIPVRRSLRNDPAFHSMTIQTQFATQIPNLFYGPRVPFVLEYQAELDLALERALRGTASPEQALHDATTRLNAVIERDRLLYAHAAEAHP